MPCNEIGSAYISHQNIPTHTKPVKRCFLAVECVLRSAFLGIVY